MNRRLLVLPDDADVTTKPRSQRVAAATPPPEPCDMLIALYAMPSMLAQPPALGEDIDVRAPLAPEHDRVVAWIGETFSAGWASEARAALNNRPPSLVIAVERAQRILGFCCHDAVALGFVGPVGVAERSRSGGVGAALLRASLERMRAQGYGYAIVGAVGAPGFFASVAGAVPIAASWPGVYRGMLRNRPG